MEHGVDMEDMTEARYEKIADGSQDRCQFDGVRLQTTYLEGIWQQMQCPKCGITVNRP